MVCCDNSSIVVVGQPKTAADVAVSATVWLSEGTLGLLTHSRVVVVVLLAAGLRGRVHAVAGVSCRLWVWHCYCVCSWWFSSVIDLTVGSRFGQAGKYNMRVTFFPRVQACARL